MKILRTVYSQAQGCVWAVGRLGVAAAFLACVSAAAVDWQARQSCLGWCGGVN